MHHFPTKTLNTISSIRFWKETLFLTLGKLNDHSHICSIVLILLLMSVLCFASNLYFPSRVVQPKLKLQQPQNVVFLREFVERILTIFDDCLSELLHWRNVMSYQQRQSSFCATKLLQDYNSRQKEKKMRVKAFLVYTLRHCADQKLRLKLYQHP